MKSVELRQPKVFPFSLTTAFFERSGYYTLSFLLVLYVTSAFHFTDHDSYVLFSAFNALVFLAPAIGGYLADNIIGIRRTMILGIICEGLGLLILSLPTEKGLLVALALVVVGVGLFKVGPTDLLGRAYGHEDPRIDSGFTLFYMAMNAGGFLAPFIGGFLRAFFGWHIAFSYGTLVFVLGAIAFFFMQHRGFESDSLPGKQKLDAKKWGMLIGGIALSFVLCAILLNFAVIATIFLVTTVGVLLIYFFNEIRKSPKKEKLEITACLTLILIAMIFFIMYFQYSMSITLYLKRCINHTIFGWTAPEELFLSLNCFWVIAVSPILVFIYNSLEKKGKDLAITTKFALGLLITSFCFITLYCSQFFSDQNFQVSAWWMVLAILLFSIGELLVSALGVAMITRIAPKRLYGVMMGAWFLIASSMAAIIAGKVADLSSVPSNITDPALVLSIYGRAFGEMGIIGIVFGVIVFLVGPYIKKIANLK